MARLLILIALVPIIATLITRWWFGLRILSTAARHSCSCDLALWEKNLGKENLPDGKSGNAILFAQCLRRQALVDWKASEPKAYLAREAIKRFGKAVPPLSLLIVLLGILVGRIPAIWIFPVFLLTLAFAALSSYLSITPELHATLKAASRLRAAKCFHRSEDEDMVLAATTALAWKEAAPPVFHLLQK